MERILSLTYASSLADLCEVNSSFDAGILRIAYAGENGNGTYISKETFEKCLPSLYNCPIVAHYDRDSDTLGGHDMDVVRDDDGELRLVNITTPVGCIPESAKVFWQTVTEEDGTEHEYLCAEALIWKRQEAYDKIKRDGITSQSMEIAVKDGETIDHVYHIRDFEFTAFALIGVEPCFESAALEFSRQNIKEQYAKMMNELKESAFAIRGALHGEGQGKGASLEGGEKAMETDAMKTTENGESKETRSGKSAYTLNKGLRDEIAKTIQEAEVVNTDWGEEPRYWFDDFDSEAGMVYAWDSADDRLYGIPFTLHGDAVKLDWDGKKRVKYCIVDFDEGEETEGPQENLFSALHDKIHNMRDEMTQQLYESSEKILRAENELTELRNFKKDTEAQALAKEREQVFASFEDLKGVEEFDALRASAEQTQYDAKTLEEKCYAIRGKRTTVTFSAEPKSPKIKVGKEETAKAPYGGLFEEYGIGAE